MENDAAASLSISDMVALVERQSSAAPALHFSLDDGRYPEVTLTGDHSSRFFRISLDYEIFRVKTDGGFTGAFPEWGRAEQHELLQELVAFARLYLSGSCQVIPGSRWRQRRIVAATGDREFVLRCR